MRAPSATSYVWLFMTTFYLVLFLHNATAVAGRTAGSSSSSAASSHKRPRSGSSIEPPPAGETANPLPDRWKRLKGSYRDKSFPECRIVSVGYYGLFGRNIWPNHGAPGTSRARKHILAGMLPSASEVSCQTKCQREIANFEITLGNAFGTHLPWCWASGRFSIVQRRADSVGCDAPVTPGCSLTSSLCQCTFNLIILEQMNETKHESRGYRKKSNRGADPATSVCDMRRFPATISYVLHEKIQNLRSVMDKFSEAAEKEKRSWPLYGWHSVPNEAVILGEPFACSEPPAKKSRKVIPPGGSPYKQQKKVNTEVCLCPNNRANSERQCSHKQLICETISLAQVIDKLRRGGGELFDVYVEKFPQLKEYVEPISSTAIATDQVSQQNWATLLAAVDSIPQKGLDIDLNEPAADDGDEL